MRYVLPKKVRQEIYKKKACRKCPVMDLKFGNPSETKGFFPGQLDFNKENRGVCTIQTAGCTSEHITNSMCIYKDETTSMPLCATAMLHVHKQKRIRNGRYIVLREYSRETTIYISDTSWQTGTKGVKYYERRNDNKRSNSRRTNKR